MTGYEEGGEEVGGDEGDSNGLEVDGRQQTQRQSLHKVFGVEICPFPLLLPQRGPGGRNSSLPEEQRRVGPGPLWLPARPQFQEERVCQRSETFITRLTTSLIRCLCKDRLIGLDSRKNSLS